MTRVLTVSLPSGALYVTGTVNGVEKIWTNVEGNTWETVADRSADDKYVVVLTVIDSSGLTETSEITLYYGVANLITDRTQADVNRVLALAAKGYENMTAAEREEWNSDLKGAYNASDLNRVESAVRYLADTLTALPDELKAYAAEKGVAWDVFFDVPYDPKAYGVTTKVNWLAGDIPDAEDMLRYLANVKLLRGALEYATDELPGDMVNLAHTGANAIEKALRGLYDAINALRAGTQRLLDKTAAAWFFSGEIYTGEV